MRDIVLRMRYDITRTDGHHAIWATERDDTATRVRFATRFATRLVTVSIQDNSNEINAYLDKNPGHIVAGQYVDGFTENDALR